MLPTRNLRMHGATLPLPHPAQAPHQPLWRCAAVIDGSRHAFPKTQILHPVRARNTFFSLQVAADGKAVLPPSSIHPMPYSLILTHPGSSHKDEFLACCVLLADHRVPIVRREPTAGELADPSVAVVDVGRRRPNPFKNPCPKPSGNRERRRNDRGSRMIDRDEKVEAVAKTTSAGLTATSRNSGSFA